MKWLVLIPSLLLISIVVGCQRSPIPTVVPTTVATMVPAPTALLTNTRVTPVIATVTRTVVPTKTAVPIPTLKGIQHPREGKYIFIELETVIKGTGILPPRNIDFPTYLFFPGDGELKPYPAPFGNVPRLSPDNLGFIGVSTKYEYPAGSGMASGLQSIDTLPISTGFMFVAVLLVVSEDGSVEIVMNDQQRILGAGQYYSWTKVVNHESTIVTDRDTLNFKGQYTYRHSVTNYGWNDRLKIYSIK